MQQAKLIVFDGGDSVGKATQVDFLMRRLVAEGKKAQKVDFPRYEQNVFGGLLRECLDGKRGDFMSVDPKIAATLYAADRFETKAELEKYLTEGEIVLLDRYVSANMIHQGAKIADEAGRQAFFDWVEKVEYEVFGMPRPDITVHLSVPPEKSKVLLDYMVGIGKKEADVAESDRDHQEKVAVCAQQLAQTREGWVQVTCMEGEELRPREAIHEDVYELIAKHL